MREWNSEFPFLNKFGNSGLFFRTDLMLIGIRFDRLWGESYRPILEGIPLWNTSTDWKKRNSFYNIVKDNPKFKIECKYIFHDRYFHRNVEWIRQLYGYMLSGQKVTYAELYDYKEEYHNFYRGLDCIFQMPYLQYKLLLATYFNDVKNIEKVWDEVENSCKKWSKNTKDLESLQSEGISIEEWREKMYNYYGNREAFMKVCSSRSEDKAVKKLNYATLINEPPIIKTPLQEWLTFNWLKNFFDKYFGY